MLKTEVNKLDKKASDATTLTLMNQLHTDKENMEKNIKLLIKNYQVLKV